MNQTYSIKSWADDDRPREKLETKGKRSLSNVELLAILINSGTKTKTAVDVARSILKDLNGDLNALAKVSVQDLCKYEGMGKVRSITVISAMELCRRRKPESTTNKMTITSSSDIYSEMKTHLADELYEQFWMLCLNRANKLVNTALISNGGLTGTVADPRKIFKIALENSASGVIFCHNHPSGNIKPSDADISLTKKLKMAGEYLDIAVLDHLIIGGESYYSFADNGRM